MEPGNVKTLGVRLPDDLHAQFSLIAQLEGISLSEAVKRAVEHFVRAKQSEPDFAARAAAVVDEIEREAANRRGAIQALFTGTTPTPAEEAKPASKRRGTEASS